MKMKLEKKERPRRKEWDLWLGLLLLWLLGDGNDVVEAAFFLAARACSGDSYFLGLPRFFFGATATE